MILNEESKIPSCGSDYHKDINISTTPAITELQAQDTAYYFKEQKENLESRLVAVAALESV